MPQAIAETVFDIFYLGFAVITGHNRRKTQ